MNSKNFSDLKIVIIVQARLESTRLPRKIFKEVLGKTLLEYQIERMKKVLLCDLIVIATTTNPLDQPIVDFCWKNNLFVTKGSEFDVLDRYLKSALEVGADVVIRLTSDCPLIDPRIVNQCLKFYLMNYPTFDYVSNTLERTFPRGMDTEIFSVESLIKTAQLAKDPSEREHVTKYIYSNPEQFSLGSYKSNLDLSNYRLTVDTNEDFLLIKHILEALYPKEPNFKLEDIIELLEKKPEWVSINAHIKQKP